jgi:hypothetical protein
MKSLKTIPMALAALFLIIGCLRKPTSVGGETDIYVIADSSDWRILEPTLKEVFEREIQTPQTEKVFELLWAPPQKLNEVATKKNLILTGALEPGGEVIPKIGLSDEVKQRVVEGTAFVFPKRDQWANEQLMVVLVSNTLEQLREKILENRKFLYELFEKKLRDDTVAAMFREHEQLELEKELLDKYGWTLRIQHDYVINVERPQDRFLMLRRSLPGRERWLFVHWIDKGDSSMLSEKWAMNTRDRLTMKFYQNDKINEQYTHSREVDFLNRKAILLEGLWENDEKVIGGPFRSYSFYDARSRRIYMIDLAVFYPGGEKEPFLRQLDIMAQTFKTAQEMSAPANQQLGDG